MTCITFKCTFSICYLIKPIHESILFGFPGSSDDAIAIHYCMLDAKYYIYLKKLKEENKKENLM